MLNSESSTTDVVVWFRRYSERVSVSLIGKPPFLTLDRGWKMGQTATEWPRARGSVYCPSGQVRVLPFS